MAYLDNNDRVVRENEFLKRLKIATSNFHDTMKDLEHLIIISHQDADGFASAVLLSQMSKHEKIPHTIFHYNRNGTWCNYLNSTIIPTVEHLENYAIIFADLGAEVTEIAECIRGKNISVYILDHHEMEPYDESDIPETMYIVNPTEFGYDGLKEIAGSTLVYLFIKEISKKNIKNAWIALIGISNDTLMNVGDYRSFNKLVLEEAADEGQIIIKQGLMVYGATHENIKNALAHSLFPFIKEIGGKVSESQEILEKLGISANKRISNLNDSEIETINNRFPENLEGQYIIFPKKKTVLRYAFEHGLIMSVVGWRSPENAQSLISLPNAPVNFKNKYTQYIRSLTKNLGLFVKIPKTYTDNAIFVDAGKRIPSNFWSDVASYSSVNNLYNSDKILFLGGPDGNFVKLSVRCAEFYPPLIEGKGVDYVINKIRKEYGGMGGGHKLAGGYKISIPKYSKLKKNLDSLFPL